MAGKGNVSRQQRRAREREIAKGIHKPPPGAVNSSAGPMMSVYEENGRVVIHLGWQDAWINVVRMSPDDAESHARELLDLVRGMKGGLVTATKPSGLIVPQLSEQAGAGGVASPTDLSISGPQPGLHV